MIRPLWLKYFVKKKENVKIADTGGDVRIVKKKVTFNKVNDVRARFFQQNLSQVARQRRLWFL